VLGLIGVGRWGKNLARNFRQLGSLVAVCDQLPEAFRELHAPAGLHFYTHHQDLLADPEVTAVAIATRPGSHYAMTAAALSCDKDVFCEKPLCLSALQARQLQQLAIERGKILMVGHLLHYHPAIQRLKELLAEGVIGKIIHISATRLHMGGSDNETSALWDLAPHDVSIVLSLIAPLLPRAVQCLGQASGEAQMGDRGVLALEFEGGLQALIHFSSLHPYKDHRLTVCGTEATVVFDETLAHDRQLQLYPRGDRSCLLPARALFVESVEPLFRECSHFLECCRSRRPPLTEVAEAIRVLDVLEAAQMSLREGRAATSLDVLLSQKELDISLPIGPL
jgi:UDP-2-acetamido-3-amino-2,3-dideoxy-glucuronate N-acetyltransferase